MAKGFSFKKDKLYSIQIEETVGWQTIEENVTKERCAEIYDRLLYEGIAPERIRIDRVS